MPPNASCCAELYPLMRKTFLSWFPLTVIFIGIVGSGSSLAVLLQRRLFPAQVNLWLVSIAVGDVLVLLTEALRFGVKGVADDLDLRDLSSAGCRAHVFLCGMFNYWSALTQAAFSLQRLVAVYWPTRARIHVTPKRVWLLWAVLILLSGLPNVTYLVRWSVNPRNNDCEPDNQQLYRVTTLMDLVFAGLLPLSAMVVATTAISMRLFKQQRRLTDKEMDESPTEGQPRKISVSSAHLKHRERSSVILSRLLVFLNLWYFLTTFPYLLYVVILNFGPSDIPQPLHKFLFYLFRCLFFLNAAFNWAFYLASGRAFRRAWLKLWLPVWPLPPTSRTTTGSCRKRSSECEAEPKCAVSNPAFQEAETNVDDDDGVWR